MNFESPIKPLLACVAVLFTIFIGVAFPQSERGQSPPKRADIMSFEEYVKKTHPVPYLLKLSIGKGRLLYFGTRHTYDPRDPEIAEMEKAWAKLRPEIAFFEGADPESTPPAVKTREDIASNGEPSFVLFLATRDHVPVRTLEPSRADELELLLKTYSREEVKVFYVLRQVPEFKSGQHKETIEVYTQNVLSWLSLRPELKGRPNTVAELQETVSRLFPKLADWREVPQSWFDPAVSTSLTFLTDISRELSEFRDRHMVTVLLEQVGQGKRVFAAVGASHVVMQERALRVRTNTGRRK